MNNRAAGGYVISWETMILSTLSSTMCFRRRRLFTLAPHSVTQSLTHSLTRRACKLERALPRQLLGTRLAPLPLRRQAKPLRRRRWMAMPTTYFLMHISMGLEDPYSFLC